MCAQHYRFKFQGSRQESHTQKLRCSESYSTFFSVFIILAIVGVVLYQAMRVIERRYLFWSGEHMRAIGS